MKKNILEVNVRIIFYIPDFWAGGAQKQAALLFNELARRMPGNVMLIYVRDGPNSKWLDPSLGSVVKLEYESISDPRLFFDLARLAKSFKATHLISWLHGGDTAAGIASWIGFRTLKWIIMERDSSYPKGLKFAVREFLGKTASKIICNSDPGVEYWRRLGYPIKRLERVHNILPDHGGGNAGYVQDTVVESDDFSFVSWGRMVPQKDPLRVARAFRLIVDQGGRDNRRRQQRCLMGGDGPLLREVQIIAGKRSDENFCIPGYISDPTRYLRRTPIYVSLSKHEGTPNAVLEAVKADCLVVLSDIEEHRAVVGKSYPFLISESLSDADVALKLVEADELSSDARRQLLGEARDYLMKTRPAAVVDDFITKLK
jgi:glycosyltransferase involved in cell wall biosynthesis